jgi:hypothetical protein
MMFVSLMRSSYLLNPERSQSPSGCGLGDLGTTVKSCFYAYRGSIKDGLEESIGGTKST